MIVEPRGVRNRNPGNLRISRSDWRGKIVPSRDPEFETFEHAVYGIRALAKLLLAYYLKYGLNTISAIIDRWAPPSENDTGSYVNAVARACDKRPDDLFAVTTPSELAKLVKAIIAHENGQQPYSDLTIREGVALALL